MSSYCGRMMVVLHFLLKCQREPKHSKSDDKAHNNHSLPLKNKSSATFWSTNVRLCGRNWLSVFHMGFMKQLEYLSKFSEGHKRDQSILLELNKIMNHLWLVLKKSTKLGCNQCLSREPSGSLQTES